MKLKPSPRLHKNIAICHPQLMAASPEGSQKQLRHAAAAIEAYAEALKSASALEGLHEKAQADGERTSPGEESQPAHNRLAKRLDRLF